LHREDSEVFSIACGVPAPEKITDVAPTILSHFEGSETSAAKGAAAEENVA
jgi:hypothetical protein